MKKILLFLGLFFIGISVKAQTYYSDYGTWSKYTTDIINENELREVEVERRYKWYKSECDGEYLLYNDGINNYEFFDLDNYKETRYSSWSLDVKEEVFGRTIENKTNYSVKKVKPIKKIYITSGRFTTREVNLNEIKIYNKDKIVNFTSICGECSEKYTMDNISGILIIELDNYYYFDDLTIVIKPIDKSVINSLNFMVTTPLENSNEERIYYLFLYEKNDEDDITLNVKDFDKIDPEYEEEQIYQEKPKLSYSDELKEINYYRYKDKLYYFYNIKKVYLSNYLKEKDGYIKDENDYLDYYRYRNRDKLELDDYIEINNKEESVEDYIKSTTEYKINGSINYDKNGVYIVNVETYFIKKNIPVLINIKENEKTNVVIVEKENQDLINDYNDLKNEYQKLLADYKKLVNENKNILDNYNNLKEYQNKLLTDYNMIEQNNKELLNNYNDLKQEYQKLLDNYTKLKEREIKLEDEKNNLLNKYNELVEIKNNLEYDYENLKNEKNNLFINYQNIDSKYNKLLEENSINLEDNICKEELEKITLKNSDNEKKLKLINQAYDYLNSTLLNINKSDFSLDFNWHLWLLLLFLLLIILVIIMFKMNKNKNKF